MLDVINLRKIYKGSQNGIFDAKFSCEKGTITGIAGPNGSGKTTFINALVGFIKKDSGTATLNGHDLDSLKIQKRIANVSDDILLINDLTGREYLSFIERVYQVSNRTKKDQLLELFNLEEDIDHLISSYSHGMKKKIQLIASFIQDFDLLILDEPCRGLDIESIFILKKILQQFQKKDKIILISSHDLLFVEEICNEMIIISKGKILDKGIPKVLKDKYRTTSIEEVFLKSTLMAEREGKIEALLFDFSNND